MMFSYAITSNHYPQYEVTWMNANSTYALSDPAWRQFEVVQATFKEAVAQGIAMREIWIGRWRQFVALVPPKLQAMALTICRSPARKCAKDARRWKRRRFVQGLAA